MAKMVLKAAYLDLSGNNLSTYASKIELKAEVEDKDVTTFGSSGWKESLTGLFSGGLSIGFKQDVAAGLLDAIMWPLFIAGALVTFEVRLSNAAVGTSNPKFTGSVLLKEWNPIGGSVGDVAEVDVTYPTSGVITRATA
jgi:hypothetical protein